MGTNKKRSVEMVPVDSLKLHPDNPREGNVEAISQSIRENGFYGVCLVQKSTRRIIVGKHRYLAAKEEGQKTVPVMWLDVDDAKAKRIMLADNRTSDIATNDEPRLKALLEEILKEQGSLEGTGYSADDLDELVASLNPPQIIEDEAPPISKRAKSKKGQIYKLGNHRLLCGDATKKADIKKLFGKETANFCFTSPPYSDQRDYEKSSETLDPEHLAKFLHAPVELFAVNLGIKRKDDEVVQYWDAYILEAKSAGLKFLSWNVWDKGDCGSIGNQTAMFGIRHEWIFVFGKRKKLKRTVPTKHPGESNHPGFRQKDGSVKRGKEFVIGEFKQLETVINQTSLKARNTGCDHPGLMVEIEPRYCDVIRKRWWSFVNGDEKGWEKVTSA